MRFSRTVVVYAALAAASLVTSLAVATSAHAATNVIGGAVWNDTNRNGVQDSAESPFSNVSINVYDSTWNYVTGATTGSDGAYQTPTVANGTYIVQIDYSNWQSMHDTWVPTTTGSLAYQMNVTVSGATTANFGFRQIVRSTNISSPISTYSGSTHLLVNSYDDAVTAQSIYADLMTGQLIGPEAAATTVYFDYGTNTDAATAVSGSQAPYSNFRAQLYITYDSWATQDDETLFHEYGHAWSEYNAYMVQGDPSLTSYLKARGLYGNPKLGSNSLWEPDEMFAEDYRQLFGSANAASFPQANPDIPPASQVSGLKAFLQNTYDQPPSGGSSGGSSGQASTQPAPTVSSVSPAVIPQSGGQITVAGTNFSGSGWTTTAVHIGSASATFTVTSPTQLAISAPTGTGQQHVTVTTTSSGNGTNVTSATGSGDVVSYAAVPTVSSISPASGSLKGGTTVTLNGSNFSGPGYAVTSVQFGGVTAGKVTVVSPTQLTVTSPSVSKTGTVDVIVTSAGGSSATSVGDRYTYARK